MRVLLVEDNAVNSRLASLFLEKRGHLVSLAANGREALDALRERRFEVIVTDISMPEMDGLEMAAAIRFQEKATGTHIPIVAMTAHAMQGDRERCFAAGMDGYISKPIQAKELFEAIEGLAAAVAG
jgi:CheY-like chemotaxis protein